VAANRRLFVELGVNDRKLAAGLRKSEKKFKDFGRKTARGLKKAFSGLKLAVGAGLGLGLAAVGTDVFKFEDTLDRLSTQAGITASETDALREKILALSKDTGISRNQVVGAVKAMIDLGTGMEFAEANMTVLTDANIATGASMEDLAALAFSLKNNFGIVNPEDLTAGLNAMIEAGKQGSIPLDQMASTLKKVAAEFAEFKGTGVQAAAEVGIAMQLLGRKGFSSAEEAGTGIVAMMTALKRKAGKLRKFGVEVFETDENGVKSFRTIEAIIEDIGNSKLAKDPELMTKILGRSEAEKAVKALVRQQDLFKDQLVLARKSNAIADDGDKRRKSVAFRIQKSTNRAREALAEAFTPERIEKFVAAIEKLADLISIFIDNLGAAIALWAATKFGPGAASLAMAGGSLLGRTGVGASINAAKTGALGAKGIAGAAGLLTASLALGVAFGTLLDDTFGLSDALADFMHSVIPWNDEVVARAGESNRVSALQERLAKGRPLVT
jgi:TP901 family phage tail tape measure protein